MITRSVAIHRRSQPATVSGAVPGESIETSRFRRPARSHLRGRRLPPSRALVHQPLPLRLQGIPHCCPVSAIAMPVRWGQIREIVGVTAPGQRHNVVHRASHAVIRPPPGELVVDRLVAKHARHPVPLSPHHELPADPDPPGTRTAGASTHHRDPPKVNGVEPNRERTGLRTWRTLDTDTKRSWRTGSWVDEPDAATWRSPVGLLGTTKAAGRIHDERLR